MAGAAQAAALVDQWLDWQATRFTPATRDAFWQTVRTPPEKRDQAVIDRSVAASEECAAILDGHLMGRAYAVGDHFTAADIALGAATHRWLHLDVPRIERPALRAWYERISGPGPAAALALPPAELSHRAMRPRRGRHPRIGYVSTRPIPNTPRRPDAARQDASRRPAGRHHRHLSPRCS